MPVLGLAEKQQFIDAIHALDILPPTLNEKQEKNLASLLSAFYGNSDYCDTTCSSARYYLLLLLCKQHSLLPALLEKINANVHEWSFHIREGTHFDTYSEEMKLKIYRGIVRAYIEKSKRNNHLNFIENVFTEAELQELESLYKLGHPQSSRNFFAILCRLDEGAAEIKALYQHGFFTEPQAISLYNLFHQNRYAIRRVLFLRNELISLKQDGLINEITFSFITQFCNYSYPQEKNFIASFRQIITRFGLPMLSNSLTLLAKRSSQKSHDNTRTLNFYTWLDLLSFSIDNKDAFSESHDEAAVIEWINQFLNHSPTTTFDACTYLLLILQRLKTIKLLNKDYMDFVATALNQTSDVALLSTTLITRLELGLERATHEAILAEILSDDIVSNIYLYTHLPQPAQDSNPINTIRRIRHLVLLLQNPPSQKLTQIFAAYPESDLATFAKFILQLNPDSANTYLEALHDEGLLNARSLEMITPILFDKDDADLNLSDFAQPKLLAVAVCHLTCLDNLRKLILAHKKSIEFSSDKRHYIEKSTKLTTLITYLDRLQLLTPDHLELLYVLETVAAANMPRTDSSSFYYFSIYWEKLEKKIHAYLYELQLTCTTDERLEKFSAFLIECIEELKDEYRNKVKLNPHELIDGPVRKIALFCKEKEVSLTTEHIDKMSAITPMQLKKLNALILNLYHDDHLNSQRLNTLFLIKPHNYSDLLERENLFKAMGIEPKPTPTPIGHRTTTTNSIASLSGGAGGSALHQPNAVIDQRLSYLAREHERIFEL